MIQLGKLDCSLILEGLYTGGSTIGVPSYMTNVLSIESVTINKLTTCCETTVLATFDIISAPFDLDIDITSCPGDNCGHDGEHVEVTVGDLTNVSSYLWEVTRSNVVIWSGTNQEEDVCVPAMTGAFSLISGDILSLTVTLTDGTTVKRSKIVDNADVQSCIYTYSQSTTIISNRPYNIDSNNNIVLNSTGFGDSDGVYTITFTLNYTDNNSVAQIYTGQACQVIDCDLRCTIAAYHATKYAEQDYEEIVRIQKLYDSLLLMIECGICCSSCGMYNIIIDNLSNTESLCYGCK